MKYVYRPLPQSQAAPNFMPRLNEDLRIISVNLASMQAEIDAGGGGGATDHGALTGLSDDDHTQYHNNTRGDARYSQLGHTHSSGDITDFSEAVDDRVSSLLVAGTNVTLTYDDGANTLTVDATGGGGSAIMSWVI